VSTRQLPPAAAWRRERGFALPATIIALVLLSALIAGALFVSTEELRAGRTDVAGLRARAATEWALERAIAEWDPQRNNRLAVGASEVVADRTDARGDSVEVSATRVQLRTVWLTARATSHADGRTIPARHTVSGSLRLVAPAIPLRAALTAGGAVTIVGGTVDGLSTATDTRSAWECGGDEPAGMAGIVVPDSTRVCGETCTGAAPAGVNGAPPIATAPGLTSDSASTGAEWPGTIGRASITLVGGQLSPRPTASGQACVRDDALNWGDPGGGPCGDHYPVIRIRGDAVLAAGSVGQGILLVEGSVRLEAAARFAGVVIAANDIVVAGAGAELLGVAFARDIDGVPGSRVEDGGAIRFASCVARRAMMGAARLTRTPVRWWAELR